MQAKLTHRHGIPLADSESSRHSDKVSNLIRRRIEAAGGSVSFAEYMQHALYAPGLGYYAAGSSKFGAAGDFITAPEVSPIFASVLGRQCAQVMQQLDGGSILELGAGSGVLAAGLLQKLAALQELPDGYHILEVSADLRERQQRMLAERVPELLQKVQWLAALPENFRGVILANEVADALPVERFRIREGQVLQLRVTLQNKGFGWCTAPAPRILLEAVRDIERDIDEQLEEGFLSEVSLSLPAWTGDIADCLEEGAVFMFDYGVSRKEYYAADRADGWLRCHFRHFAHGDPLIRVGIQDLTSWVDFTSMASAASDHGLAVDGFVTQGQFLINGGIGEELTGFTDMPERQQIQLSQELKLLTLPGEMGENFKCLGMSRGKLQPVSAFSVADRAHML